MRQIYDSQGEWGGDYPSASLLGVILAEGEVLLADVRAARGDVLRLEVARRLV